MTLYRAADGRVACGVPAKSVLVSWRGHRAGI